MPRPRLSGWALLLVALPVSAAAQEQPPAPAPPVPGAPAQPAPAPVQPAPAAPAPGAPAPAYPQAPPGTPPPGPLPPGVAPPAYAPGYAPPAYAPPPGYAPGYAPPPGYGYPPPGYGYPYGYGYIPPPAPPPPPPPKPLRWSLRFDPFELVLRRMTFHAEVAVVGPFALEVQPSWIWGSPYGGIDEKGFSIAGNAVFYLANTPLRGLWLKATAAYERFDATLTNPADSTLKSPPTRLESAVIGALFGDAFVIPRSGGFILSGGIGLGVATHGTATLTAPGSASVPGATATLYDGFDKVRLLGQLGLGTAF